MASTNPFGLLGDDDNDDPSQLIAAQQQKLPAVAAKKSPAAAQAATGGAQPAKPAKLPSKPLPPAQAVKEARSEAPRGGRGGGRGSGRGRGGGGYSRDSVTGENTFGSNTGFSGGYRAPEEGDSGKTSERRGYGGPRTVGFRGGRRDGDDVEGERPRRPFERRSGTGRGNETKRDGAGRGNWGTPTDEIAPETEAPVDGNEKTVDIEKQSGQENAEDANKEIPVSEPKEEEPEDKEMTLEEYEKVLEEKRKALLALKTEERKVGLDKELESMQLISSKKGNDEIFVKLGSEKDKRKEAAEKEEKAKKSVSINEFLKPAEGERFPGGGGRGTRGGRGRGGRGSRGGGSSGTQATNYSVEAPSISDAAHFPSLGAK